MEEKEATRENFIDKWLSKVVSRKLMVWVVSTVMIFLSAGITGEQWVWISLVYIGTQGAVDIVKTMKTLV